MMLPTFSHRDRRRDRNDLLADERGQVLLMAVVQMVVFIGFLGLVVDTGLSFDRRRQMFTSADAAALAGALEKQRNPSTTQVVAVARDNAAANGFTHGADDVEVEVFAPPTSGPFAGQSTYVEAIITQSRPTFFMSLLDVLSTEVRARAVAGQTDSNGCVLALNETKSRSLWVHGTAIITA